MQFDPNQIKGYLAAEGEAQAELFKEADRVRRETIGDKVHFRGIIEFSNACEKNCLYCGIRRDNLKTTRYRMTPAEIDSCIEFIHRAGYGSVVLQSGELTTPSAKKFLLKTVQKIHQEHPEMGITLSCGELDADFLKQLRQAGANRYLLRIETSVPSLYRKWHPADHSHDHRLETLNNLRKLDYQVGTGCMVGVPGQTLDDMVADLHFFQEKDFDMFGLGPYVIHADTPMGTPENTAWWNENKAKIFSTTLNFISVLRLLMPTANIAAATALDVFDPEGRTKALRVGANVIMPSVTPQNYRTAYLIYQNKPCVDENAEKCYGCMITRVKRAGLTPALKEIGTSLHYTNRTHGKKS